MNQFLEEDLQILAAYISKLGLGGSSIMVTGVTGLIGSLILRAISKYNENNNSQIKCIAIARSSEKVVEVFKERLLGVEFGYQDICTDIPRNRRVDYIVHAASPTASKYFITYPVETIESICLGTMKVLEYAKDIHAKGVVYLSSMEVYGQTQVTGERLSEEDIGYIDLSDVRSCYPESKRLAECLCKCYAVEYGVPVRVARLAQVFGAGVLPTENRVFAQFARSALQGKDIVLHTTGESMGNYCYTRDAIKAILLLLVEGKNGEAYSVTNESATMRIREMAQVVTDVISPEQVKVTFDITPNKIYGYAPDSNLRISAQKIMGLGWSSEVGLEDAFYRMAECMKEDDACY